MNTKSHRSLSKNHTLAGALAVALLGAPVAAQANSTGHLCSVNYYPGTSSLGNHGYIGFSVYTGAKCTGSYLNNYYLATTGSSIGYVLYDANQIQTMLKSLLSAMYAGRVVSPGNMSTGQGSINVANSLYFY